MSRIDKMHPSVAIAALLVGLLGASLALYAVGLSASTQYPRHPDCRGMLGAGFPVLYICDNWGGGSPTNSWDRIDFVDVLNGGLQPAGFALDFLFYALPSWTALLVAAFAARAAYRRMRPARKQAG